MLNYSIVLVALLISLNGCERDDKEIIQPIMPSVEFFSLGSNAVTIKSDLIVSVNPIDSVGLCWDTSANPTVFNTRVQVLLSDSAMYFRIENLSPNTKYYGKLYAVNNDRIWYGEEFSFITSNTVKDIESHVYNTVKIGEQIWMVENLRTTRFNDGADIPCISSTWSGLETPGYCNYDFFIPNTNLYGALYNWPTVNSNKLCPDGWHIPSDSEWETLVQSIGGRDVAGSLIKSSESIYWAESNLFATNLSGFSAIPGGASNGGTIGTFLGLGYNGFWWTSTVDYSYDLNFGYNIFWAVSHGSPSIIRNGFMNKAGALNFLSVRCIKD